MAAAITRKKIMPNYVSVKVCDELYDLIAQEADRLNKPMIDIVVAAIAEKFGRPDLASVPRRPMGRPRTNRVAEEPNGHKLAGAGS